MAAEMPKGTPTGTGLAALFVLAASTVASLTASSEGRRLKPYADPAGIVSYCYGETHGTPKASYTDEECRTLLQNRLAASFAPQVAKCLPQLADKQRIKVFAAFLDAAYNAGPNAVCASPMARYARANNLPKACSAFLGWYVTAHYRGKPEPAAAMRKAGWYWTGTYWRKQLPGLVTRRRNEAKLCVSGI